MADWDHDEHRSDLGAYNAFGDRQDGPRSDWRGREGRAEPRHVDFDRPPEDARTYERGWDRRPAPRGGGRGEHPAPYEREAGPFRAGGGGGRGYGEGGDSAYGQQTRGSSDDGLGGYSGSNVGGFGQPVQNSQWGQGGYAPLNQGLDYGQDGGRFGPRGYDSGDFGGARDRGGSGRDEHHHHYSRWRDTQMANHDRDYSRWRDEQARRYDEDYRSWRDERHATFSKEFEGWRSGRAGQSTGPTPTASTGYVSSSTDVRPSERDMSGSSAPLSPTEGTIHGANPTLARIAEGRDGHKHEHHKSDDRGDQD